MKLYLVRHGESEANVSKIIYEDPETPLTKRGRKQAEFVGKRFLSIPVDLIVASTFLRAKETASIIQKIIDKPLLYSSLPVERRRPSATLGLERGDKRIGDVYQEIKNNFHLPNWRHSDEETLEELSKRAKETLDFILSQKKESIILVSHGMFMRVLLVYMIFGEEATPDIFWKFLYDVFATENTGITICSYNEKERGKEYPGWRIITWNDHAHLGEVDEKEIL